MVISIDLLSWAALCIILDILSQQYMQIQYFPFAIFIKYTK
jgi:hypothetical protein